MEKRMLKEHPLVLRVETGFVPPEPGMDKPPSNVLDYRAYVGFPRWWRKLEKLIRLDLYLALRARKMADRYDIIWAGSEKVAIPLSFMGLSKPLVVVVHHIEAKLLAIPVRALRIAHRWAAVGYVADATKEFMMRYFGLPPERLFPYFAPDLKRFTPSDLVTEGPIMSVGTEKRDYRTLIAALSDLPGYETEIYASSRYGATYRGRIQNTVPSWVHFMTYVSDEELVNRYKRARFVVIPLVNTSHAGAGASVACEASACGKAVIATKTAGMSSFVIDGQTGLLVPPGDSQALRDAIRHLWTQPHLAHQMGLAGRQHIERNFNIDIVNRNISEMLDRVYMESQRGS